MNSKMHIEVFQNGENDETKFDVEKIGDVLAGKLMQALTDLGLDDDDNPARYEVFIETDTDPEKYGADVIDIKLTDRGLAKEVMTAFCEYLADLNNASANTVFTQVTMRFTEIKERRMTYTDMMNEQK